MESTITTPEFLAWMENPPMVFYSIYRDGNFELLYDQNHIQSMIDYLSARPKTPYFVNLCDQDTFEKISTIIDKIKNISSIYNKSLIDNSLRLLKTTKSNFNKSKYTPWYITYSNISDRLHPENRIKVCNWTMTMRYSGYFLPDDILQKQEFDHPKFYFKFRGKSEFTSEIIYYTDGYMRIISPNRFMMISNPVDVKNLPSNINSLDNATTGKLYYTLYYLLENSYELFSKKGRFKKFINGLDQFLIQKI